MTVNETPSYTTVSSKGKIEIRDYSPMILAEVQVSGERKQAIRDGFKILADYIFGNNCPKQKLPMTAPVIQEQLMDRWKVRFVMPKQYPLETLPKPNSKDVLLVPLPAKRFAVIRFSGRTTDENIQQHTRELEGYIADQQLRTLGETVFAFYNPPWTLPFLRRNEIMREIELDAE